MTMQTIASGPAVVPRGNAGDSSYLGYLDRVGGRFSKLPADSRLFETDAAGLWEAYLAEFPADSRQYHNCGSCKRFVETYGGLVTIAEDGSVESAIWNPDDCPTASELAPVTAMLKLIRRAKVTGPFLSSEPMWGQPVTGNWRHVHLTPSRERLYPKGGALTAGQAAAEKREDFKNVVRALDEYPAAAIHQALALLKSEALFRSEKVLGPCQFLADLHAAVVAHPHRRANVIWRAIAAAPAGFCHPRSSMIGTLLDDIVAGVPFEDAARKFRIKMDPLHYQRPQAAPSAGAIQVAEKLVEKLGVGPSLVRRFARLEEIEAVWRPTPAAQPEQTGGVFGHLKPKGSAPAPSMVAPPQVMTWAKFSSSALPGAKTIEVLVPGHGHFTAILTAEKADAPPILQWDSTDRRNPFSTYVYRNGSPASQWGVAGNTWVKVSAIALQPQQWFGETFAHQGKGVVIVLEGAKDSRTGQGNAIFPEALKSELHGIRATVEAYSKSATIQGLEQASACGLALGGNGNSARLRVTDANGVQSEFTIDRLE